MWLKCQRTQSPRGPCIIKSGGLVWIAFNHGYIRKFKERWSERRKNQEMDEPRLLKQLSSLYFYIQWKWICLDAVSTHELCFFFPFVPFTHNINSSQLSRRGWVRNRRRPNFQQVGGGVNRKGPAEKQTQRHDFLCVREQMFYLLPISTKRAALNPDTSLKWLFYVQELTVFPL